MIVLRTVFRTRTLAVSVIATLGLAIGLSTSVFSLVNALLLRPLPYRDANQLAVVASSFANSGRQPVSFDDFEDWRRDSKTMESAAAYQTYYHPVLTGAGQAERLSCLLVSHGYFEVMKVQPHLGRFFVPEEDRDGRDAVVVLSYDFWRSRFQADPGVIGRTILLDQRPQTIVGVAPQALPPLPRSMAAEAPQIYRALGERIGPGSRDGRHLDTIVRLKRGVSIEQAQADLDVRCRQMEKEHEADRHVGASIANLHEFMTRGVRTPLLSLQGAVLLLLIMACANIANLLLARASGRQKEMAIRQALGAGTARLAGMLLKESLVYGALGGLAGVVIAVWISDGITAMAARVLPDVGAMVMDARVLTFAVGLSVVAAVVFGVAPVFSFPADRMEAGLKQGGRSAGTGRNGMRHFLAAVQIALALVLLISTGLLGKSFLRLRQVNPGFDPQGVLTGSVAMPSAKYRGDTAKLQFLGRMISNLQATPGVASVAAVSVVPMAGDFDRTAVQMEGHARRETEQWSPDRYIVTVDYFRTLRIVLRQGRLFSSGDDAEHPAVCVINESAARQWFPGESPLGKKVRAGGTGPYDQSPFREVVGVVEDVAQYELGAAHTAQIYMPYAQFSLYYMTLLVRTTGDPAAIAGPMRQAVSAADSEQPLYNVAPLEDIVANTMAARRLGLWFVATFGVVALLLAAAGTYGVMAYWVSRRMFDFGIRIALGAQPSQVMRHAMADSVRTTFIGLALGLMGSYAASRLIASFLFGVDAVDRGTYAAVTLFLAGVALAACYLPARRAAGVDPIIVLRSE